MRSPSRSRRRWSIFTTLAVAWPTAASADSAPDEWRSGTYYAVHGTTTGALLLGSELTRLLFLDGTPGYDPTWFPGDLSVRGNHSSQAARLSDTTFALALVVPVAGELGRGVGPAFGNAGVVYAETLSANLFLNTLVKFTVRRPRPYASANAENGVPFPEPTEDGAESQISFYSGHSSTTFAAAMSGSYLFAEHTPDRTSRCTMWASELALAAATANLRVRAGKHYYSDVIAGALVGTGLGIGLPYLHGGRYRPELAEIAAAAGGVVVGMLATQLLPLGDKPSKSGGRGWTLAPLAGPVIGLQGSGSF
ncbi:MAG TPA: phosphatase PAP2 family protein [Polyangiaceae bacterium]|nr:phosphatase PAP2 family protein [Polyangiaceae bacterium]